MVSVMYRQKAENDAATIPARPGHGNGNCRAQPTDHEGNARTPGPGGGMGGGRAERNIQTEQGQSRYHLFFADRCSKLDLVKASEIAGKLLLGGKYSFEFRPDSADRSRLRPAAVESRVDPDRSVKGADETVVARAPDHNRAVPVAQKVATAPAGIPGVVAGKGENSRKLGRVSQPLWLTGQNAQP